MSALIKTSTILGSMAVTATAASYSLKASAKGFSQTALNAAEHGDRILINGHPKMPKTYLCVTIGGRKYSNA